MAPAKRAYPNSSRLRPDYYFMYHIPIVLAVLFERMSYCMDLLPMIDTNSDGVFDDNELGKLHSQDYTGAVVPYEEFKKLIDTNQDGQCSYEEVRYFIYDNSMVDSITSILMGFIAYESIHILYELYTGKCPSLSHVSLIMAAWLLFFETTEMFIYSFQGVTYVNASIQWSHLVSLDTLYDVTYSFTPCLIAFGWWLYTKSK